MGDPNQEDPYGSLFNMDMSQYPNLSADFSFEQPPDLYQTQHQMVQSSRHQQLSQLSQQQLVQMPQQQLVQMPQQQQQRVQMPQQQQQLVQMPHQQQLVQMPQQQQQQLVHLPHQQILQMPNQQILQLPTQPLQEQQHFAPVNLNLLSYEPLPISKNCTWVPINFCFNHHLNNLVWKTVIHLICSKFLLHNLPMY